MNRIEADSKYGLATERTAEPPARLAANMNGKSGRQQLDAARTLPMAPRLASVSTISFLLCLSQCRPNHVLGWKSARVVPASQTALGNMSGIDIDIEPVNPNGRRAKEVQL